MNQRDRLYWMGLTVVALAVVLAYVYVDPSDLEGERVDSLAGGPWVVRVDSPVGPLYMALRDIGEAGRYEPGFSPSLAEAWHYETAAAARAASAMYPGSYVRAIRSVLEEVHS